MACEVGTPQGATVPPLLANIYLHYVFDLWVQQWRRRHAQGDMIVLRYADECAPRRRGKEAVTAA
jgi:retron-type reverse transcriptase